MAQLLSICSERGDLADESPRPEFPTPRLDGRSARSRVLYDNPGDTLLRRRYIYRPWSTLQVPAVLCYAVGSCRSWSTLQARGFVPISGLLHAVGTGLEYPAGIRFAAKTRRDSFTPSVPALEYPAEVPGVVRNPGGTLLRRRYRTLQVHIRFTAKTRRDSFTPSLEYPAGARFCAKTRRCSVSLEYPAGARFCAKTRRYSVTPAHREYPAGIRFAAKTRRDSFTPSVPALEYPAEVPGVVRNSGGTLLRRRFRPRVPCRYQVMCETPAVLCYTVGTGLAYPAGTYQVYC